MAEEPGTDYSGRESGKFIIIKIIIEKFRIVKFCIPRIDLIDTIRRSRDTTYSTNNSEWLDRAGAAAESPTNYNCERPGRPG